MLTVCKATKTVLSGDPEEPLLIGKILCAVDPENIRLQMLSDAMSLARSNRSTIFFFSVGEPSQTNRVFSNFREILLPENEHDCAVELIQVAGNPVQEIVKAMERLEIDLVVVGHHSRTMTTFETLGSVTLRVIPRAKCAVFVVQE